MVAFNHQDDAFRVPSINTRNSIVSLCNLPLLRVRILWGGDFLDMEDGACAGKAPLTVALVFEVRLSFRRGGGRRFAGSASPSEGVCLLLRVRVAGISIAVSSARVACAEEMATVCSLSFGSRVISALSLNFLVGCGCWYFA